MALIDFTLSNARRFYSSMGNPLGWKGLNERTTEASSQVIITGQVQSIMKYFSGLDHLTFHSKCNFNLREVLLATVHYITELLSYRHNNIVHHSNHFNLIIAEIVYEMGSHFTSFAFSCNTMTQSYVHF